MSKKEDIMQKVGSWAFILGLVIAIVAGLPFLNLPAQLVILILAIAGFLVGFINVTAKESVPFLVASIALVVASSATNVIVSATLAGINAEVARSLGIILNNIGIFVAPAAMIVALRAIYALASSE